MGRDDKFLFRSRHEGDDGQAVWWGDTSDPKDPDLPGVFRHVEEDPWVI